ncbi:MAG: ribosome maturation factor RimM [Firmicutes bacterium]|nr:ribosome maturation factor RimM [Bacillota bacterium]
MTENQEISDVTVSDLLEIGRIGKPHGLKGQLLVRPVTNRLERFEPKSRLFAYLESELIELSVEVSAPYKSGFLIKFVGYDDMNAAEQLKGLLLLGSPLPLGKDELFVHEMIGKTLIDQHGTSHGKVVAVEANPASDLLVLENSGLVPLVFVTSMSEEEIFVDIPEGLLS